MRGTSTVGTPSIADYALIGDCHGTALIHREGDIHWACLRRFDDSPSFARLLDPKGGAFQLGPKDLKSARRRYLPDTNVLETELVTATGKLTVLDAFAMRLDGQRDPYHQLLRRLVCTEGEVELSIAIEPRFDYGSLHPRLRRDSDASLFSASGGKDAFVLWTDGTLEIDHETVAFRGNERLRQGENRRFAITAFLAEEMVASPLRPEEFDRRLDSTIQWWRDWTAGGRYPERHRDAVVRSALLLKLLTCAPTGAIIAAPTTSLPETIDGVRNWDYRYAWVRDAGMTMAALLSVGHEEVAHGLRRFLQRTCGHTAAEIQIMYGCHGERRLDEIELTNLAGFRNSRPVRVGNGAYAQRQLDVFGEFLTTAWLDQQLEPIDVDDWRFLCSVVDEAIRRWKEPDRGIWESRGAPQHFVHSKAMCWLALERGLELAKKLRLPVDSERWQRARDEIRASIDSHGVDPKRGCFVRAYGSEAVDASLLRLALIGFVAPDDPRFVATVDAIRKDLGEGPFLRRYLPDDGSPDGLPPHEGAFLACAFWLVDVLAMQGKVHEAEKLFEELLSWSNDVGLLPEEIDPDTGEFLGNFPQAFSHTGVINAAQQLQKERSAEDRGRPVTERTSRRHHKLQG